MERGNENKCRARGKEGEVAGAQVQLARTCNTNADGWKENTQYFAYVFKYPCHAST